ncbi:ABC-type metal ion transport system, periplasmic component/surface adhesin [Desulfocurvibacter africanus PCS]|uniref:ABC-type metal ion transport system, periplasmic component/surface adhesin n=1 Tax=Desulfocurvibacter africanus PCS TaxID=1262666 RepID=M5PQ91_DESAF|nr:zinc ABC transporter substrate-binding protein [Desulfocurvibacter africanus]EMG36165.1 ABC-type metal ion transport system, periplasmic component/surface adhesin [Desulfocurvibacter africanus PCS]
MKRILTCFLLLTVLLASTLAQAEAVEVFVSIVPQKYFVERIAGDLAEVSVMVLPGASPHIYEPKPRQLASLQSARAYFTIGDSFEQAWMPRLKAANPNLLLVATDAGVTKIPMASHPQGEEGEEHGHEANHADAAEHDHGGLDPHIWLSPKLVKIQAANILEGLKAVDPENAATYEANCQAFLSELDALDARIRAILAPARSKEFLVFHPSWGYFAQDYGLVQVPIEIEGKEPKPEELVKLAGFASKHRIRAIFVQPQFSRATANVVAREIKAELIVADPLAGNWDRNLIQVAEKLRLTLQ